jgi:opacity protein-like surface antigen
MGNTRGARRWLITASAACALASSACSAAAPPTPDVIVLRWMQAFASADGSTVAQLTCHADQADSQNNRLVADALGVPPPTFGGAGGSGQFFGGGGGQPQYDINGLAYTTSFADGDAAKVQIKGFVRMTSGMVSQSLPVNSSVALIREQDQWRVCDPPTSSASLSREGLLSPKRR